MKNKTYDEILSECREKALQACPAITDALIELARNGNYQAAKFLLEFVEPPEAKAAKDEDDIPGPSLAEILIERLQLLEAENAAETTACTEGLARA